MTAFVLTRTGQLRPVVRDTRTGRFDQFFQQALEACGQFFDQVDIDHFRNQIKNLSASLLFKRRSEIKMFRERAHKQFGSKSWWLLLRYEVERYLRGARHEIPAFHRLEKFLFVAFVCVLMSTIASAVTAQGTNSAFIQNERLTEETSVPMPQSWLSGEADARGSREAVMGAYTYATTAGYTFVENESDRERLVSAGALEVIDSRYIELVDVSEPYAMPVVAQFVNRLGELHASKGCGKLVVTSALRTLEHQDTLANGSRYSVHPTGMSIDLRRPVDEESFCGSWLKRTLLEIEETGRIDMTAENKPRHYHVVVLPNEYQAWLARQPIGLDSDVKWLATALYFEGAFNESMEGYRAIGWAIRNRVRSEEFPNTILEVVAEGAAGRSAGGCQFSFMCDGKAERIQTLCTQPDALMTQYWLDKCDERWEVVVNIAKQILAEEHDPTNGAVLYYAASMDNAPYWARTDMKRGTVSRFGSHLFACSNNRGDDACEV